MTQIVSVIGTPKSVDRQLSQIVWSQQRNDSVQNNRKVYQEQIRPSTLQSQIPIVGLRNPRYYCYLNSALQVLLSIHQLTENILSIQPKYGQKFLTAYQELLRSIGSYSQIAPQNVQEVCSGKFQYNQQQDSHEFLLFFFGQNSRRISGEQNKIGVIINQKINDIIDFIFAGQYLQVNLILNHVIKYVKSMILYGICLYQYINHLLELI